MAITYWLTFRIDDGYASGRDYDDRRNALIGVITRLAEQVWEETTSFYLFDTESRFDELLRELKNAIAPSADVFLIRPMIGQDARYCGALEDESTLKRLMPYAKRV